MAQSQQDQDQRGIQVTLKLQSLGIDNSNVDYTNISNDITQSYSTSYNQQTATTIVTITTALNAGVEPNRYHFLGWFDSNDIRVGNLSGTYSFEVSGSGSGSGTRGDSYTFTAKYREYCYIENMVGVISPVEAATEIRFRKMDDNPFTAGWYVINTPITCQLIGRDDSNYDIVNWTSKYDHEPAKNIVGATGDIIYLPLKIDAEAQLTVTCNLVSISNAFTIDLDVVGGGSVDLYTSSGSSKWTYENTYNVGGYTISISAGTDVKLKAIETANNKFENYVVDYEPDLVNTVHGTYTSQEIVLSQLGITPPTGDIVTITATFDNMPWINKIGTIIKVF